VVNPHRSDASWAKIAAWLAFHSRLSFLISSRLLSSYVSKFSRPTWPALTNQYILGEAEEGNEHDARNAQRRSQSAYKSSSGDYLV
jgi:hypothetical protein